MRSAIAFAFAIYAVARSSIAAVPAGNTAKTAVLPVRAVLVVQNHTSDAPVLPLAAFADSLAALLSGGRFAVINPYNAIGTDQNRTARGEPMPEASAAELARKLRADAVITASIQELRGVDIGVPAVAHTLKARITLNIADAATAATPFGVSVANSSGNYTVGQVAADKAHLFENLLADTAAKAAGKFLAEADKRDWRPETAKVDFTCNRPGAVIKVDEVAVGTLPLKVEAVKGRHKVRIEYPFCSPYEAETDFTGGGKYGIVLNLNDEGVARYKDMKRFEQEIERRKAAGETEDRVRLMLADACAKCRVEQARQAGGNCGKGKKATSAPAKRGKQKVRKAKPIVADTDNENISCMGGRLSAAAGNMAHEDARPNVNNTLVNPDQHEKAQKPKRK